MIALHQTDASAMCTVPLISSLCYDYSTSCCSSWLFSQPGQHQFCFALAGRSRSAGAAQAKLLGYIIHSDRASQTNYHYISSAGLLSLKGHWVVLILSVLWFWLVFSFHFAARSSLGPAGATQAKLRMYIIQSDRTSPTYHQQKPSVLLSKMPLNDSTILCYLFGFVVLFFRFQRSLVGILS